MEPLERDAATTGQVPAHDHRHIVGWGADLKRADRPGVPMERMPPRLPGAPIAPPMRQVSTVKVFHSTERDGMTPLFGTPVPPTGVSGVMRGWAFRHSENDLRHWLLLLAADRVNMVEGIVMDFARGSVPNVFAEMGGRALWRHDRAGTIKKALLVSAVFAAALYGLYRRGPRGSRRR